MSSLLIKIYVGRTLSEQLLVTCDMNKDVTIAGTGSGETGNDNIKLERVNSVEAFGDTDLVTEKNDISSNINNLKIDSHPEGHHCVSVNRQKYRSRKGIIRLCMDGYLLSLFINVLGSSVCYRNKVINNFRLLKGTDSLHNKSLQVAIKLKSPVRHIIDYSWEVNEKLERILIIHRESDNALSWLSTLGGAFSALGDYMEHCAVIAGRISVHQLRIALKLGDPLIAARCKLWLALSMIQRGYLRRAKCLIREQYQLAHSLPVLDTRLVRMCYGIWAKLQYVHRTKHQAKKKKSTRSL